MGALSRLKRKYESGGNYALGNSLSGTAVSTLFGTGGDDINVIQEHNGFAWKVINIRSEALADQEIFVERQIKDKWQEDERHEFNKVLAGGEGDLDKYELLEAHQVSMDLYGEAFWYFTTGERMSKPMGRMLLDPTAMTVLVAGNRVTGYVYQKDGQRIVFDLDEIAHFRIHDPSRPFRGSGPMQKSGWFVRSARYTYTYVNNFLENNAIPAGVIVGSSDVNDDDWKLFKRQWTEKHSGIDNAGKTGFVRGSELDFVKTGLSLGEVDFEKMKNSSRDDVLAMFGIPGALMGIFEDVNRASSVSVRQLFAQTFTSPALKRVQRKLTPKVQKWYGTEYQIGSSNPIPEDRELKLDEYDKGVGRWITINEAREAYGLDPIKGGDVIASETQAPAAPPKKTIGKVRIKTVTKADFSYEMKESFRSETEELQKKYEKKFYQEVNPILKAQKEMILDQLKPRKITDGHFNAHEEAEKLGKAVLPLFLALADEQGLLAVQFAGNAGSKFVLTAPMKKYIEQSVMKAAATFTKDTQDKIAKEIAEGLQEGESISKVGKRINGVYDEVLGVKTPGFRTERLARTEVIKASNEITEAAYKQSGVVQKKEWFANPGRCEFCASLDGSIISLGATFVPKDSTLEGANGGTRVNSYEDVRHPPVHPSCRCTLIPVVES